MIQCSLRQMALFKAREDFLRNELSGKMMMARANEVPIFDTWMFSESDNVQALATAYGEVSFISSAFQPRIQWFIDELPTPSKA
jgi:hypothetical protein